MGNVTNSVDMNLSKSGDSEGQESGAAVHGGCKRELDTTES